jgi:hypothetical protein
MGIKLGLSPLMNMDENRILRRIFAANKEDITGGRRKLHSEEFFNLYHILLG